MHKYFLLYSISLFYVQNITPFIGVKEAYFILLLCSGTVLSLLSNLFSTVTQGQFCLSIQVSTLQRAVFIRIDPVVVDVTAFPSDPRLRRSARSSPRHRGIRLFHDGDDPAGEDLVGPRASRGAPDHGRGSCDLRPPFRSSCSAKILWVFASFLFV